MELKESERAVLDFLQRNGPMHRKGIVYAMNTQVHTVAIALKTLKQSDLIEIVPPPAVFTRNGKKRRPDRRLHYYHVKP
jgi:Mn-dependent DtxR family transcriptional regulator